MSTSLCSSCREPFVRVRAGQGLCPACGLVQRDAAAVAQHLRSASADRSREAVAKATGLTVERVEHLARTGALESGVADELIDANSCTCPPQTSGRCPACRARIARGFGEVVSEIHLAAKQGAPGLRARRS